MTPFTALAEGLQGYAPTDGRQLYGRPVARLPGKAGQPDYRTGPGDALTRGDATPTGPGTEPRRPRACKTAVGVAAMRRFVEHLHGRFDDQSDGSSRSLSKAREHRRREGLVRPGRFPAKVRAAAELRQRWWSWSILRRSGGPRG